MNETDPNQFKKLGTAYLRARKKLFARLSPDDHKYFSFQLWLEGIACYTEIKTAEAATNYQPAAAYLRLPDYQSFAAYSLRARADTVDELKQADLAKKRRVFVYSFGAAEGLLLDRLKPDWQLAYLKQPFSAYSLFAMP